MKTMKINELVLAFHTKGDKPLPAFIKAYHDRGVAFIDLPEEKTASLPAALVECWKLGYKPLVWENDNGSRWDVPGLTSNFEDWWSGDEIVVVEVNI